MSTRYPFWDACARLENGAVTAGDPATVVGLEATGVAGSIAPRQAVLHPVPYGMGSGWSSWEEAMSSQPR